MAVAEIEVANADLDLGLKGAPNFQVYHGAQIQFPP
jgi:hypothetical protein